MTHHRKTRIAASLITGVAAALMVMGMSAFLGVGGVQAGGTILVIVGIIALLAGSIIAWSAWSHAKPPHGASHATRHEQVPCAMCGGSMNDDWRLCPHCGARTRDETAGSVTSAPVR